MFLTQSPFIEFRDNPYTTPLTEYWETIRKEYWFSCETEKLRVAGNWIDNPIADKPNGDTSAHFPGMLYEGSFKSTCLMIKENMLDEREKFALQWGEDEKVRWWQFRVGLMPFLGYYTAHNISILSSVTFNTILPGSVLNFHWGLDPDYIRIHLCLDEAEGCVFNIEGWERQWKDGEVFGFDDANVLHGTRHTGTKPRSIMLMDIRKDVIKPYCKNWPCRESRPPREYWATIKESCLTIGS